MIVIVIIGVVYTLVITKLHVYQKEENKLSLQTLKPFLAKIAKEQDGIAKLICIDGCKECFIYVGKTKVASLENFLKTDDGTVAVYRYDYLNGMTQKDPDVFFNKENVQEDVCFSFSVDKNRVSDQVFVVYQDKVFDYTNYFSDVDKYDSLEEAQEAQEKIIEEVK